MVVTKNKWLFPVMIKLFVREIYIVKLFLISHHNFKVSKISLVICCVKTKFEAC